jgi:hypothetical protein
LLDRNYLAIFEDVLIGEDIRVIVMFAAKMNNRAEIQAEVKQAGR